MLLRGALPLFLDPAVHAQYTPIRPVTSQQAEAWQLNLPPLLLPVHLSSCLPDLYGLTNLPFQRIPSENLSHLHLKLWWLCFCCMFFVHMVFERGFRLGFASAIGLG